MTSRGMHYAFKQGLNKLDSQKNRNLKVPEIDWILNEAQDLFVSMVAEPREKGPYGVEKNQRNRDDIRTLISPPINLSTTVSGTKSFTVDLPANYNYYIASSCFATKGSLSRILKTRMRQHDDDFEGSSHSKSSFEWCLSNMIAEGNKLRLFTDGTFSIDSLNLTYIKRPTRIHNAQDAQGGSYKDLETGQYLTGTQDCILPETAHDDIVSMAVMLAAGKLNYADFQTKFNLLKLNLS